MFNFESQSLERRFLYSLLSDIFILTPDREFLEKIHHEDIYFFLKKFLDNPKSIKDLGKYISFLINNNEAMLELEATYENTFSIPVAIYYIPLYMSAFINYTDLRSNSSFYTIGEELEFIYARYGLHFNHRSDHISVIFSFMVNLINMEISENNVHTTEEQKIFFKKYVVTWAGIFFNEILQRCENKFYKFFASIGKNFIINENRLINSAM